jgi:hypothetical protein
MGADFEATVQRSATRVRVGSAICGAPDGDDPAWGEIATQPVFKSCKSEPACASFQTW